MKDNSCTWNALWALQFVRRSTNTKNFLTLKERGKPKKKDLYLDVIAQYWLFFNDFVGEWDLKMIQADAQDDFTHTASTSRPCFCGQNSVTEQ